MAFKVRIIVEAARKWTDRELVGAVEYLNYVDRAIKTGADARTAVTNGIVRACARLRAHETPRLSMRPAR
jgi:hypothetical protein